MDMSTLIESTKVTLLAVAWKVAGALVLENAVLARGVLLEVVVVADEVVRRHVQQHRDGRPERGHVVQLEA